MKRVKTGVKWKRLLSIILALILMLSMTACTENDNNATSDGDDELPENIIANKESFDTINQVIETYETKFANMKMSPTQYQTSINGEQKIRRINFLQFDEPVDVSGGVVYDIPVDIAKVFRLFGNMRFSGSEGFITDSNMVMSIIDPDGTEYPLDNHHIFWSGEYVIDDQPLFTTYTPINSITDSSIVTPWDNKNEDGSINYEGYKLKLQGNGTLDFVYIWEEQGMPTEYDTSAYTVMGKDKPILDVTVDVDTTKNLSMNGVNKFDSDIFKRYHVNSGPVQLFSQISDWILDDDVFFKTKHDWGFKPGRGAFHFSAAYDGMGLVEAANNPGWSDFTELYKNYEQNDTVINKLNTLYPSIGKDYVITFDGWPRWTWEDSNDESMSEHFATPAYDKFDSAADTAAQLLKAIDTRMGGYGPKYLEVKNESTIINEWNFFNTDTRDGAWEKLGEFHNIVADEIKAVNPDVLVGGPSSAFMYLERDDFSEAQYQLDFMDDTKDSLDWYSHHFYENSNLYVNGRKDNSDGFLAGRFEAVMDLLQAHMANTDNVKPILITEEGSYNSLGTDIDYFGVLTAYNGYLLRFTDYADAVGMLVPYVYPVISWDPNRTIQFYRYNDNQTGILEEMTPLEAYLDLWKEFKGAYVPSQVSCDDSLAEERVFTKATRYGNKVYLAVQNLNDQRVNLDLNVLLGDDVNVSSATQKHYFLEKAELTYEEIPVEDLSNVYMRVQEMAVFEITLDNNTPFETQLLRKVDYAKEELVDTGKNVEFTIGTTIEDIEKSILRVGYGKVGSGFDGDLTVKVNGKKVGQRSLEYTNKSGDLLTFIEFDTKTSILKDGENKVVVSMPEGGKITSVQLMNYYTKEAQTGLDTTAVKDKMQEAIDLITDNIYISENGLMHPEGSKWITQIYYDAFVLAIRDAEVVLNDTFASESEINDTLAMLDVAIDEFKKNLQDPVGELLQLETVSFEDGETQAVTVPDVTNSTATVVEENATEGSKALKFTMTNLNDEPNNYWLNKQVAFDCPESDGWDLSKGFSVDINNINDFDGQIYLAATDASGKTGTIWRPLPANAVSTIIFDDFSSRADWTEESFGFADGLDGQRITQISMYFLEASALEAGQTDYTVYIDNIKSNNTEVVPFDLIAFEDGEAVNYTVSENDTISEIVDIDGNKAFKMTALTTDDTWGKLSILGFVATPGRVWDFSSCNLNFDATNPHDYDVPMAVFYDSADGTSNSAWINVPANQTMAVDAEPWEPAADATKITSVRIFFNESAMVGTENVSIIMDNIKSDWTEPVNEEEEIVLVPVVKPEFDLS